MIQVIDNIVDDDVNLNYRRQLFYNFPWYVVKDIGGRNMDNIDSPDLVQYGLSHLFYAYNLVEHSDLTWRFLPILYETCKKANISVDRLLAMRSFYHPPSTQPSKLNNIHVDFQEPHLVCLYYVNDSDGDTVFFDDKDNEIHRQTPKKNTAVIFNGAIRHCSSTPSMHRVIFNFDFTVAI